MNPSRRRREPDVSGAFTLIEIMIVVALIGIAAATGIPPFVRALKKEPLRQAVSDVVDGLGAARAQAILRCAPYDWVLRSEDGLISVQAAPRRTNETAAARMLAASPSPEPPEPAGSEPAFFSARLHRDVAVTQVDVNLRDRMGAPEARVRFYPNGTCDDFTVSLETPLGVRIITVDPLTSQVDVLSPR
jgi:prepilin-type N-terminal cleavage/methylation domain-containing protein